MDKCKARAISKWFEMNQDFLKEFGVVAKYASGNYSDDMFTVKIELAEPKSDGSIPSKEANDYQRFCHRYGMNREDLGVRFKNEDGEEYEIIGAKPRSRRTPILAKRLDTGDVYRMSPGVVKMCLKGQKNG